MPFGDPQDEMIAQHYRDIIEDVLREYDNFFPDNVYEALAWVGLKGKGSINPVTSLPQNPTKAWENVPLNDRFF